MRENVVGNEGDQDLGRGIDTEWGKGIECINLDQVDGDGPDQDQSRAIETNIALIVNDANAVLKMYPMYLMLV